MKRLYFAICLILIAAVAYSAPGDKRPAVTSAAIGLGTSSSATMGSVTATTSVTAPAFNSSAADGYHYILPYNSSAFAGTPLVGMIQTTPTGPQWYTGSAWEAIGSGGDSLPSQTGNSGKYLTTNGTAASWGTIAAGSGIAISADIPTDTGAAYLNDSTHVLTVASTTGYTQFTGSFTAWDTTPAAFTFTDETDIALSTAKTSNAITVAGINYPAAISVTGDTGYGYSKNSAACTATSGTVVSGDTVAACVTSSGSNSTATTATVTIGGVSDTYSVTSVSGSSSISDSFAYSDGALATVSSGVWAIPSYATAVNVSSNAAVASTDWSENMAYWANWTGGADQCNTIVYTTVGGMSGPAVRVGASTRSYYYYSGAGGDIFRVTNGSETSIGTLSTSTTGDTIKLCAAGTNPVVISFTRNGGSTVTINDSDSSRILAGYPGMRITRTGEGITSAAISAN